MPKLVAAAVALLCLVPFAGCGGDDDDSSSASGGGNALTKAEFIKQGDTVCAGLTESTQAIAEPTSEDEVSGYLTDTIALAKKARSDFAALSPPADGEDIHEALLDSIDGSISAAEEALEAAEDGDLEKMGELLDKASDLGDEADEDADAYGFKECGTSASDG